MSFIPKDYQRPSYNRGYKASSPFGSTQGRSVLTGRFGPAASPGGAGGPAPLPKPRGYLIARIIDGPRAGQVLIVRERAWYKPSEHPAIDPIDHIVFRDGHKTIYPAKTSGVPKGAIDRDDETTRQAAIREFVEEIGTFVPDGDIVPLQGFEGAFVWNVTQDMATQIINTFYSGPTHVKRYNEGDPTIPADSLVASVNNQDGTPMYHFYSVPGPAWQEHEAFIPQFININRSFTLPEDREVLTQGGIDVPEDFKIIGREDLWYWLTSNIKLNLPTSEIKIALSNLGLLPGQVNAVGPYGGSQGGGSRRKSRKNKRKIRKSSKKSRRMNKVNKY